MKSISFSPRKVEHYLYFVGAVFLAGIVINTILRRLPDAIAGPLQSASAGL